MAKLAEDGKEGKDRKFPSKDSYDRLIDLAPSELRDELHKCLAELGLSYQREDPLIRLVLVSGIYAQYIETIARRIEVAAPSQNAQHAEAPLPQLLTPANNRASLGIAVILTAMIAIPLGAFFSGEDWLTGLYCLGLLVLGGILRPLILSGTLRIYRSVKILLGRD